MYIVAIGWAYVILMMAITASTIGKALAILIFLGVLPLALFVYVVGGSRRRGHSMTLANEVPRQGDGSNPKTD